MSALGDLLAREARGARRDGMLWQFFAGLIIITALVAGLAVLATLGLAQLVALTWATFGAATIAIVPAVLGLLWAAWHSLVVLSEEDDPDAL